MIYSSETKASPEKLKILISAFSCWPGKGSELGVGWNWADQAAKHHHVWVLTLSEGREAIESYLESRERSCATFVYVDVPFWPTWLIQPRNCVRLYYFLWQLVVLFKAYELHRKHNFDAVHHVTMNTIEVPGFLWMLEPPFYWGPVGGGQEPPTTLKRYFGRGWIFELLRIIRKRLVPLNPIVRLAVRKSTVILAANNDTCRLLRRCGAVDVVRELETAVCVNGVDLRNRAIRAGSHFAVVWAGAFIPRKAPFLAVDVIAELRNRGIPIRMFMAGDGPLRSATERYISEQDLEEAVFLVGNLQYEKMSEFYCKGDVFLFTSLHDTSGNVLLEAMAHHLPVVILDHQGAAEIVAEGCGYRVPPADELSVIDGMANALESLYVNSELRFKLGTNARERVDQFYTWEHKARLLESLYAVK